MKQQKRAHSTRKSKFVAGASTGPTGVNAPLYNYISLARLFVTVGDFMRHQNFAIN